MEKKWEAGLDKDKAISLAVETLLEVVEDAGNIEILVCTGEKEFSGVEDEMLKRIVA